MSICGAKNRCPSRGHLVLTGSTPMWWRRCSRSAVRTVGRRKSRLSHRFSPCASQTALPTPWHVWCLNRSAPRNALISSHIFSSGGKVGPKPRSLKSLSVGSIPPPPPAAISGHPLRVNYDRQFGIDVLVCVKSRVAAHQGPAGWFPYIRRRHPRPFWCLPRKSDYS